MGSSRATIAVLSARGFKVISEGPLRQALRGVGVRHIQLKNVEQEEQVFESPFVVSPSNHGPAEPHIENETALYLGDLLIDGGVAAC